jgi:hypothetical protein
MTPAESGRLQVGLQGGRLRNIFFIFSMRILVWPNQSWMELAVAAELCGKLCSPLCSMRRSLGRGDLSSFFFFVVDLSQARRLAAQLAA